MYNVGNFLNEGWGKVNDAQFFTPVVVTSPGVSVNAAGQYLFANFPNALINDVLERRSLWEARWGLEFRF